MEEIEVNTELECRSLINFLFINVKNKSDYLKVNEYYQSLLENKNINNIHYELLMMINPNSTPSETAEYLLNKDGYKDLFFEYFKSNSINLDYFHNLNSFIFRVFNSVNLKDINSLLKKAKDYLFVVNSDTLDDIKKLKLNYKKINLLNLLNIEFNFQISYFLQYKKVSDDFYELINTLKELLINNCFLICEILKINDFSITNISLDSVNQTEKATLTNTSNIRGSDEAIDLLKKYLSERKIIDSKTILIDLSKKTVTETIKLYQEKHRIDLERRFINKALDRWLANDFFAFTDAKKIKVNNKVIPFIYCLKSIT